ncbi:hypothetical protein BX600DRAFT_475982 [Xylariales sp. PMI_506]|nr:hypothetical protein BX600DRAFT_475982 [Xylariales sp. PMI_506]
MHILYEGRFVKDLAARRTSGSAPLLLPVFEDTATPVRPPVRGGPSVLSASDPMQVSAGRHFRSKRAAGITAATPRWRPFMGRGPAMPSLGLPTQLPPLESRGGRPIPGRFKTRDLPMPDALSRRVGRRRRIELTWANRCSTRTTASCPLPGSASLLNAPARWSRGVYKRHLLSTLVRREAVCIADTAPPRMLTVAVLTSVGTQQLELTSSQGHSTK